MDISKISFFVNINLNKSYCKDCIIYMAHIVLDLSLPSVFSSFFAIFKFLLRTHHAPHVVHASRRYTCAPIRNPIRSTLSFAVSISVRSSTRIHFAFRDHEGEHYITWLFRMTILRLMRRTCMYRILHTLNTSTSSDIYNILLSKLPQNASTFIFISLLQSEAFNSSRSLRKYL